MYDVMMRFNTEERHPEKDKVTERKKPNKNNEKE